MLGDDGGSVQHVEIPLCLKTKSELCGHKFQVIVSEKRHHFTVAM